MKITKDKATWGDGPWQTEPDRKEWRDAATGLPCLANRNMRSGNWCGYVAVPPGHPAHGKGYDDADFEVHGGLTYEGECQGEICHVASPGEPDNVWWFGFDCAHAFDIMPAMAARERVLGLREDAGTGDDPDWRDVYRDLAYVEAQCAELAKQLAALTA